MNPPPAPSSKPPALRSEAALPARIGPYRPRAVLGKGGMATVYLAEGAQGLVALKVPHPTLSAQSTYSRMFACEAQLAAEIEHPHVCRVFGFGQQQGVAYLAMEYLRGCSLATIARRSEPITDPTRHAALAARVLADACEGLQAIHEHGSELECPPRVVHRDISPDNLFLTTQGFVKIIDFGLAKADDTSRDRTAPGIVKGKISYIAPELLKGAPASAQSDLWSLGVVAWELLTGKRLFHAASDLETLIAVQQQEIPRPSAVVTGLPKGLDAIVLRALRRAPEERYRSAAEFAEVLWAYLARSTVVQHRELAAAWVRDPQGAPETKRDGSVSRSGRRQLAGAGARRHSRSRTTLRGALGRSRSFWRSSPAVRRSSLLLAGLMVALLLATFNPAQVRLPNLWADTSRQP